MTASTIAAATLAASFLGVTSEPAAASEDAVVLADAAHLSADTIQATPGSLEAASVAFARALEAGSVDRMSAILAPGGIRLHLDGPGHAGLSSRQAVATLRDFLRRYGENEAFVTRAAPVDGSPDRGFAELQWGARVPGTSQTVYHSLFLGLVRQSGDWRVAEVRLLR